MAQMGHYQDLELCEGSNGFRACTQNLLGSNLRQDNDPVVNPVVNRVKDLYVLAPYLH